MNKSIYEEAIENAQILMGLISLYERNAKKKLDMLNQIEKALEKALEQAENQKKLLELYKQLNKLYQELYTIELSQLVLNQNYYEIEIIKLKQQIKELEK